MSEREPAVSEMRFVTVFPLYSNKEQLSDRQRAGRREKQAVMGAERRGDETLNKPEKMEASYRSSFRGKDQHQRQRLQMEMIAAP